MGGSKKQTIGYKYFLGVHMILCHGPIDSISRIEVDKKVAWLGLSTGGSITINQPTMFGGDEKEGGIQGTLDIEMGNSGQVQNSYLASILGPIIPAYRSVVGVVLRQMYLGNSAYPKPWSFRGTRVQKTSDGATQWYPSKAGILVDFPSNPILVATTDSWELAYSTSGEYTNPPASPKNSGYSAPTPGPFNKDAGASPGTVLAVSYGNWIRRTVSVSKDSVLRIFGGGDNSCAIYFDGSKIWDPNPTNTQVSGHSFSVEALALAGTHTIHIYFRDELPILIDNGSISVEIEIVSTVQTDMNPAHVIREALTDKIWGMGYNAADIEDSVFEDAADTLYSEGLGISLIWDRSMSIEAFIEEVLRHIDSSLFVSRTTGKWNMKLIRADYAVASLLTLDESNISSVSNPNRVAFGELSNSVTVKFWDYVTGEDDSVTITDTALARVQQNQLINASVNYPGFTNKRNAIIAAQRDLKALSIGFFSCTIIADSSAKDLNIGSAFKFTWPEWEIYDMVMRVTGISFGDGKNNKIRIVASEDIYGTTTNPQVSSDGSAWVDPSQPPGAIQYQMAEEVPYYEAVQNYGQTDVDNKIALNQDIGFVMAAAARPDGAINGRMWIDVGSGYEESSVLDFAPFGLSPALTPNDLTFTLTDFSDLDLVAIGSYAQIGVSPNCEFIRVDDIDSGTGEITVGRGCLDTTPKTFDAGEPVFFLDTYNAVDPTEYVDGETVNVKITSITGLGEFDVLAATELPVTLDKRAFRPYAPGQFQINSEYYPDNEFPLNGSLTSTWVGRDRLQQTSSVIYDHLFGNIGPEAGVTYRFRGFIDNVLITTVEPATSGNVWTPTGYEGLARIEIHSKRDGFYSFQPVMHEFLYSNNPVQTRQENDTMKKTEDSELLRLRED